MMINSINNIPLSNQLDENILRSLLTYHKLLKAVEPYKITNLELWANEKQCYGGSEKIIQTGVSQ